MPLCIGFQLFHTFQKFQVVKFSETIGISGTNGTFGTRVRHKLGAFARNRSGRSRDADSGRK